MVLHQRRCKYILVVHKLLYRFILLVFIEVTTISDLYCRYDDGSEGSFVAEGGHACKCGANCKCDPCNC